MYSKVDFIFFFILEFELFVVIKDGSESKLRKYILLITCGSKKKKHERKRKDFLHWPGIEPGPPAWQARILPLNHQCSTC